LGNRRLFEIRPQRIRFVAEIKYARSNRSERYVRVSQWLRMLRFHSTIRHSALIDSTAHVGDSAGGAVAERHIS
jgi:hypothetical protein